MLRIIFNSILNISSPLSNKHIIPNMYKPELLIWSDTQDICKGSVWQKYVGHLKCLFFYHDHTICIMEDYSSQGNLENTDIKYTPKKENYISPCLKTLAMSP